MKTYLFPGLGFDHRIFSKLNLGRLPFEYIDWVEPLERESIKNYAKRMSGSISEGSEKRVLIGHSFGGIICQEIAVIKSVEKVILISSIKSRNELPFHFKIVSPFNLHKLFTKRWTFKTFEFWGKNHGYETDELKTLFKDMVGGHSDIYLQWALKELSTWSSPEIPANTKIFHMHGGKDKTFPIDRIGNLNYLIDSGDHLMVYKEPDLISEKIKEAIFGSN